MIEKTIRRENIIPDLEEEKKMSSHKTSLLEDRDILLKLAGGICQFLYNINLSIEYANKYFYSLIGSNSQNVTMGDCSFYKILPEKTYKGIYQEIEKNIKQGKEEFDFEFSLDESDHTFIWLIAKCRYDSLNHMIYGIFLNVTTQKQREEELRISNEINSIVVEQERILTLRYHIPTKVLYAPSEICRRFNVPAVCVNWPEVSEQYNLVVGDIKEYNQFYYDMLEGKPTGSVTKQLRETNGDIKWFSEDYTLIYDLNHFPLYGIVSIRDVTKQRENELVCEKWKQTYESQQAESIGYYESNLTKDIFETVSGQIASILPKAYCHSFTSITNYVANNLVYFADKEDYLKVFSRKTLIGKYTVGEKEIQFEHRRLDEQGQPFWVLAVLQMFPDPYSDNIKCFTLIKNIDFEKRARLKLEERSSRDELTGLMNRCTVIDKINTVLTSQSEVCHALIMVDIDYFKQINDNWGHVFGDKILREIAGVLTESVKENGMVGRLGGDEFMILLQNIHEDLSLNDKLTKLCKNLCKQYSRNITVTGSFGVALYPRDGYNFDDLYLKSDLALYEAKRRGRNQYILYEASDIES